MSRIDTDTLIVGAGLCGLAMAEALTAQGRDVRVLEARDRVGGRILSLPGPAGAGYDLGPAWIWPHNARMLALAGRLGLTVFEQFATGRLVFQDQTGAVRRDLDFSTMAGALRIDGGLSKVVEGLHATLPRGIVRCAHAVTAVDATGHEIRVTAHGPDGPVEAVAHQLILALPPRVIAASICLRPEPEDAAMTSLRAVPTWMAGHAKLVAIYDRPFWRAQGLSGDAISHLGPLMEIHDASPPDAREGALFGFVAPNWPGGEKPDTGLEQAAIAQLAALFGPDAARPAKLLVKSWALDRETATPLDRAALSAHPAYRPLSFGAGSGLSRVLLSGTETAPDHGGFLEGALEAAQRTVAKLTA